MPRIGKPTSAPPITNRLTVRVTGPGSCQPDTDTTNPAIRRMINGLRKSRPSDCPTTRTQWPPSPRPRSASASISGITKKLSTTMFSASTTPATGATVSSRIGNPTTPLFEQAMPMTRTALAVPASPSTPRFRRSHTTSGSSCIASSCSCSISTCPFQ